jgi:hypothetical protein
MKKNKVSTRKKSTKIKQTVTALNNSASGNELYAYELIQIFAGAMKALNGGCLPLPSNWKSCLQNSLKSEGKAGKPPMPEVKKNGIKKAREVIESRMIANDDDKRVLLKTMSGNTANLTWVMQLQKY